MHPTQKPGAAESQAPPPKAAGPSQMMKTAFTGFVEVY